MPSQEARIYDHHDGHGLNESIDISGTNVHEPSGAYHDYVGKPIGVEHFEWRGGHEKARGEEAGNEMPSDCRILGPDETVLETDGYGWRFNDKVICVPLNWIGRKAKDCEREVYRQARKGGKVEYR